MFPDIAYFPGAYFPHVAYFPAASGSGGATGGGPVVGSAVVQGVKSMASYKPGDPYTGEFVTSSFSTGAAANADSLPTAGMVHNGADDGTVTLTVANVATGRYKVTGTIPSGYAAGES